MAAPPFEKSNCNYYLGDENGCFLVTENGCKILLKKRTGPVQRGIDEAPDDDDEVLLILMAFVGAISEKD